MLVCKDNCSPDLGQHRTADIGKDDRSGMQNAAVTVQGHACINSREAVHLHVGAGSAAPLC